MALGQKARQKLKRRQRSRPPAGDAAGNPRRGKGAICDLLERWADPSRGDLRRLAAAIRRGQLDAADDAFRAAIVEIVGRVIDSPASDRHIIAAATAFITCDTENIEAEERERRDVNRDRQLT